jgi:hypothetical protein
MKLKEGVYMKKRLLSAILALALALSMVAPVSATAVFGCASCKKFDVIVGWGTGHATGWGLGDICPAAWSPIRSCRRCVECCDGVHIGDVNGDGVIDVLDAIEILRFALDLPSVLDDCPIARKAALVVSDDEPGVADAIAILRHVVGLEYWLHDPTKHYCDLLNGYDHCECHYCAR